MKPYAELLEFNQPNPIRIEGFTRIRDAFQGLDEARAVYKVNETDPLDNVWYADPERIMEFAGRWDYGENNARKLGETVTMHVPRYHQTSEAVTVPIIQKYLQMGHESMIEMGDATFFIECSRVVSHELVRHRLVSYQQESQRFVKYDDIDATNYLEYFYVPDSLVENEGYDVGIWSALDEYKTLRSRGIAPQDARYVLPNAFRTRMVMKTNIREWRHILQLRLDKSAQPEMQELMKQVYDQLVMVFPNALHGVFDNGRGIR